MPCHPDRVRRNARSSTRETADDVPATLRLELRAFLLGEFDGVGGVTPLPPARRTARWRALHACVESLAD